MHRAAVCVPPGPASVAAVVLLLHLFANLRDFPASCATKQVCSALQASITTAHTWRPLLASTGVQPT
jgi:hypothetical protein